MESIPKARHKALSGRKNYRRNYDLTGETFGVSKVLRMMEERYISPKGKKHVQWEVQCSLCKTKKIVTTNNLCQGRSSSCICQSFTPEVVKRRALGNVKEDSGLVEVYGNYRRNATARNLEFNLTMNEAESLMKQDCHYCGLKPEMIMQRSKEGVPFTYNGIDRKDNTKGYSLENCLPCCKVCNRSKVDLPYQDFLNKIEAIYNNLIK